MSNFYNLKCIDNPVIFNKLCASRKHDRTLIADHLTELAITHGASIERQHREPQRGYCGAGIHLAFACKGVGAMVDICDLNGGDWVLIHWYNAYGDSHRSVRNFSPAFQSSVGSGGNGRPHHKATSHPRDWNSLAKMLDRGLMIAARGEAFSEPSAT